VSRFEAGPRASPSKKQERIYLALAIAAFGLACTTDLRPTGTARLPVSCKSLGALAAPLPPFSFGLDAKNRLPSNLSTV
jgi:hypothetical protein